MRSISRLISVELRKQASVDIVNLTVNEMLNQLPDADVIRIELFTYDQPACYTSKIGVKVHGPRCKCQEPQQ